MIFCFAGGCEDVGCDLLLGAAGYKLGDAAGKAWLTGSLYLKGVRLEERSSGRMSRDSTIVQNPSHLGHHVTPESILGHCPCPDLLPSFSEGNLLDSEATAPVFCYQR